MLLCCAVLCSAAVRLLLGKRWLLTGNRLQDLLKAAGHLCLHVLLAVQHGGSAAVSLRATEMKKQRPPAFPKNDLPPCDCCVCRLPWSGLTCNAGQVSESRHVPLMSSSGTLEHLHAACALCVRPFDEVYPTAVIRSTAYGYAAVPAGAARAAATLQCQQGTLYPPHPLPLQLFPVHCPRLSLIIAAALAPQACLKVHRGAPALAAAHELDDPP